MMDGIEVGRVNVAARACGISIRAFELAIAYAQQRPTFGKPIAQHQAIAFKLAEMGTKIEAAHALMVNAARLKDAGQRNDVEAGMAKLLASEYCAEVVQESFRIHGGYGYSKEYEIERLMREAPFLLIGEGTSRDPEDDHLAAGLLDRASSAERSGAGSVLELDGHLVDAEGVRERGQHPPGCWSRRAPGRRSSPATPARRRSASA